MYMLRGGNISKLKSHSSTLEQQTVRKNKVKMRIPGYVARLRLPNSALQHRTGGAVSPLRVFSPMQSQEK
jgi:hypothetical protein